MINCLVLYIFTNTDSIIKPRDTYLLLILSLYFIPRPIHAQYSTFFTPSDTFHPTRFYALAGTGTVMYSGLMIGLNAAWYKHQPKSSFHFFNDWNEWQNMDKYGHWFTAYSYSRLAYQGARWTGIEDRKAQWLSSSLAFFLQGSIEVLDGYAEKWGFSIPDVAFNTLGSATFFLQQRYWGEQRILAKVSSTPKFYSTDPLISTNGIPGISLAERVNDLYGASFAESFLKDYNAQTIWASVNLSSFLSQTRWPAWLNIAVGYSAENLFAGYGYSFSDNQDRFYNINPGINPRYGQLFIGPDIDFSKIPTRSGFLRMVFQALNLFKFPSPVLEYSRFQGVKLHAFYW